MQLTAPKKPSLCLQSCPRPIQALASCHNALVAFHSHCGCTIFCADGSVAFKTLEGANAFASSEDTVLLTGTTGVGQTLTATGLSFDREELALEGLHSCKALALNHSAKLSESQPWAVAAPSSRILRCYDERKRLQQTVELQGHAELQQLLLAGTWVIGTRCGTGGGKGALIFAYPDAVDAISLPESDGSTFICIAASSSEKLVAAGSADGQVLVWELPGEHEAASSARLLTKLSHDAAVQHISWDATSQKLAVSDGAVVSIWAIGSHSNKSLPALCVGHQRLARITAIAFHGSSQLLATSSDMGQVVVYDTSAVEAGEHLEPHERLTVSEHAACSNTVVAAVAWAEDNTLSAGCDSGKLVRWTVAETTPPQLNHQQADAQAQTSSQPSRSSCNGKEVLPHAHTGHRNGIFSTSEEEEPHQFESLSSALEGCSLASAMGGDHAMNGVHTTMADIDSTDVSTEPPPSSSVQQTPAEHAASGSSETSSPQPLPSSAASTPPQPNGSGEVAGRARSNHPKSARDSSLSTDSQTGRDHSNGHQTRARQHGGPGNNFRGTPLQPPPQYPLQRPPSSGGPWSPMHPSMMFVPSPVHMVPHGPVWQPGQPHMMGGMPGPPGGVYALPHNMPMVMPPPASLPPQQWPQPFRPAPYGMVPQAAVGEVLHPSPSRPGLEPRPVWHSPQQSPPMPPPHLQQQQQSMQYQRQYSRSSSGSRRGSGSSRRGSQARPPLSPSATSSDFQHIPHGASGAASGATPNRTPTATRRGSRGRGGSSAGLSSSANGSEGSPGDFLSSPRKASVGDAISQSSSAGVAAPVRTVWVGNLMGHITEQHLCDAFRPYGTITHCEVMRERGTRVSRGFGFLTFEFAPSAASARVYMNAAVLHGFGNNPICVDFSNREKEAQHEQLTAWSARTGGSASGGARMMVPRSPVTPRALYQHRACTSDGDTPIALIDGLTEASGASRTLSADQNFGGLPAGARSSACSREQLARAEKSSETALAGLILPSVSRRRLSAATPDAAPLPGLPRAMSLPNGAAEVAEGAQEAFASSLAESADQQAADGEEEAQ